MLKKILSVTICIFAISISLFVVGIPLANNHYAEQVEKELRETPLPEKTEIIDSVSQTGKLVGNGNGMQYFGAILLKSKLSLNNLEDYYSAYQKNEWSYVVEPQKTQIIEVVEHNRISFSEKVDDEGYYIVYSWGDGPDVLEGLDFRGH
jgi:hypothetical protein